jgi:transposase InsO family protein
VKLYRDHVWKHHGYLESILSDRGPQFASWFTKELNQLLGIQTRLSTAFHPQTDGQTERTNQEIEQYLRIFTNWRQTDWSEWLSLAEFSFNNKVHTATSHSPFFVNTGQHPRMGIEPIRDHKIEAVTDFTRQLDEIRNKTHAALELATQDMA